MNKFKKPEGKTYFTPCSSVSIVNFEQLNADCDETFNHREMEQSKTRTLWKLARLQ